MHNPTTQRELINNTKGVTTGKLKRILGAIALAAVALAATLFAALSGGHKEIGAIGYAALALTAAISSASLVVPGPSVIGVVAGGALLNPIAVGVVMGIGSTVGESVSYGIGKTGGEPLMRFKGAKRVRHWMDVRGKTTIFLLAAIPNPLFDISAIAAGASGMRAVPFFSTTVMGKLVRFISVALVSAYIFN